MGVWEGGLHTSVRVGALFASEQRAGRVQQLKELCSIARRARRPYQIVHVHDGHVGYVPASHPGCASSRATPTRGR